MIRVGAGVVMALAASPLAAQTPAAVRGRVLDGSTGAPIAAARVEIGLRSGLAGADGRFEVGGLPAGRAQLAVTAVGYRAERLDLDLAPGQVEDRVVRMTAVAAALPDIVVTADRASLDHESLVRRGTDLATAIDGWQGVVVRRSGGNGPASPQVRGSAPEEVIVLLDGFAINDPLTGRADLSRVPTRDVESVEVRAGPQSAGGAGTAIGGVIHIRSRASSGAVASAWAASHGSGGGTLSGAIGGARLFLSAELLPEDYTYRVPPNRGSGEGRRLNAGGTIGALSLRTQGPVAVQARASASRRGLPGPVGNETPTAEAEDLLAFLGANTPGVMTWAGSVQYLRSAVRDPTPPSGAAYRVESEGWSGTADWSWRSSPGLGGWLAETELGASARHDGFSGDVVRDGTQFTRGGVRATAALRPAASSPWVLTPSVRLDAWTGQSGPLGSARLDAGWRRSGTSLQASLGSAVSAPPLVDLFFREGVGVALNPDLRPERVRWEVELGVQQDWTAFGNPASLSVHAYYGLVDDMILWAPGVGFIWSPRNYDVIRRGIDASASVTPVRHLSVEVQGAYTPITYDVPGGAQVAYRPLGSWTAAATWGNAGWGANARWRWVGQRYPNPGGVNPRPAYGVLDAGLERAFGASVVRAEVRDILDARPEFLAGYPTPGRTAVLSVSLEWQ